MKKHPWLLIKVFPYVLFTSIFIIYGCGISPVQYILPHNAVILAVNNYMLTLNLVKAI